MIAAAFSLLIVTGLAAVQAPAPQDELREGLRALFSPAGFPDAADVFRHVSDGLGSVDDRIRETALRAIASRSLMPELRDVAGRGWQAERKLLRTLKPRVRDLVLDSNAGVREAALTAFAVLDWDEGTLARSLSEETIALCMSRYQAEADVRVRAQAVRLVAFDESAKAGRTMIAAALSDEHEAVIATAILGVEEHRMAEELPRLGALLRHASANVRLTAAGVMSTFGAGAHTYLPRLEAALDAETDQLAADTIRGAITTIRAAQRTRR